MTYWYLFNANSIRYGCKVIKTPNGSYSRSSYYMCLDSDDLNRPYYMEKYHDDMDTFTKEEFEILSKISWDFSKGVIIEMYPSGNYNIIEDCAEQEIHVYLR